MDAKSIGTRRVALMVDGDNVAASEAPQLLAAAAVEGVAVIRRVYGGEAAIRDWAKAPAFRAVFAGSGKNASDLLLAIEAVAFAAEGRADAFVVASSDRDFAHLACHLRERALAVIGVGEAKAPDAFRAACTRFVEIAPAPRAPAPADAILSEEDRRLRDALGPDGAAVATFCARMRVKRAYLDKHPTLYACESTGGDARVRWVGPR